jgi:hypothetical protein
MTKSTISVCLSASVFCLLRAILCFVVAICWETEDFFTLTGERQAEQKSPGLREGRNYNR